ncbi:hypothetical protein A2690_05095 [Candidatus Roizmanbacteria bacterium RIFCSPHIGHO2_01_FULL_39_12b]|uniref:Uncharacterized protein n=1 Tax=Candidatus Roizmanbacteria bacterium RIFCSPHIGHO2_01_FULL_39_12b TaxID=1802030 RepID=A0A1F7G906_9BACT|nr:MAG: hypothetical protein A2690_05095 [Candidatus Roizmanbacteria bacterium RIFCSPHIGHO2_01_FULL_39_12b]
MNGLFEDGNLFSCSKYITYATWPGSSGDCHGGIIKIVISPLTIKIEIIIVRILIGFNRNTF